MNSIKLTIRGVPVEVSTAADAMELIRLSEQVEAAPSPAAAIHTNGNGASSGESKASHQAADPQFVRWTSDFLHAIQSAGHVGIPTDKVVSALGVSHGRAVGGRMAIINRVIEARGFSIREIYSNKKTANGRIWKPRKFIDGAISAMDQQLKSLQ